MGYYLRLERTWSTSLPINICVPELVFVLGTMRVQEKYSSKITKGNKYMKTTLVEAAWATSRSKTNPIFAIKHRQIDARKGNKKATIAIAHKILMAVYHALRDKEPYIMHTKDKKILENRRLKMIEQLVK